MKAERKTRGPISRCKPTMCGRN